jgi:hypothetical protein
VFYFCIFSTKLDLYQATRSIKTAVDPDSRMCNTTLGRYKRSTLKGPFVGYEENEVSRIRHLYYKPLYTCV